MEVPQVGTAGEQVRGWRADLQFIDFFPGEIYGSVMDMLYIYIYV